MEFSAVCCYNCLLVFHYECDHVPHSILKIPNAFLYNKIYFFSFSTLFPSLSCSWKVEIFWYERSWRNEVRVTSSCIYAWVLFRGNQNFGNRKLVENKWVQVGRVHLAAARCSCEDRGGEETHTSDFQCGSSRPPDHKAGGEIDTSDCSVWWWFRASWL